MTGASVIALVAVSAAVMQPAYATPIGWATDVNGSFNDPTKWVGGVVPISTDDVTINTGTAGTPDTVTSSTNNTINSLTTGAHDTLASTAGTFTINNGGTNAGTISVGNNTTFQLGGTLANSGALTINSSGNTTQVLFADGTKLTGGGTVTLSDNSNNVVYSIGNTGAAVVTNVDNTISGAGTWGYSNSIGTINQSGGVFDANGLTSLIISPTGNGTVVTAHGGGFVNQGLLEATNTGGLVLSGGIFVNSGGTIKAVGTGNNVYLQGNTTIIGGTLNGSGGGVVETVTGHHAFLDGATSGQITLSGTYLGGNNTATTITGTFNNLGTFSLAGAANSTTLQFADGTTLTGGGHITLSDSTSNVVYGALNNTLETVTNVNNTISGAGTLGYSNSFEFINQAGGTINANGTNALIVQPDSNPTLVAANNGGFVNKGLMEATNTGGLVLNGGIFNNQTGTIKAAAAGDNVYLQNNTTVRGGTLDGSGGGMIESVAGQSVSLDGSTVGQIILKGTYLANNNSSTYVYGTFNNQGTFSLAAAANTTALHLADGTTLTGGGNITLSDSPNNLVYGVTNGGAETVTDVNNIISGAGTLGYSNSFEFINKSVINANGLNALIVQPTTNAGLVATNGGGFVNQNLMEATNTGGLVLNGGIFNNQAGTIKAAAAGDNVYLQGNTTVTGGTLDGSGGGMFETVAGQNASLDGATLGQITLKGTYLANNNTVTFVYGTLNNLGTFSLAGAANTTELRLADGTILTGGGNITLSDSAGVNLVFGVTNGGAETVTNVNNIISGAGTLGYSNGLEFFNQAAGVINANGTHTLHVQPATGSLVAANNGGFVNQGLMEATNSGGMALDGGIFNNAGGVIEAVGTGNNVYLELNTTVRGGTLNGSGGGIVETVAGQVASLDGSTVGQITILGNYLADNNSSTYLYGTINNQGTFTLNATANVTSLRIADGTTLTGGGTVVLSDNASNIVWGINNGGTEAFTNVDNTIQGAGQFGFSNGFKITNGGTIDANGTNPLLLQPTTNGAVGTGLVNQASGVLEGSGAGGLSIQWGTVDNQGLVLALDGSSVTYQAAATTLNNSGGTLTGGTWEAVSTGGGATVSINGTPVVTDAANILLSGAGSVFQVRNGTGTTFTPLENSLTTISALGQLQILANRNYTTNTASNDISNAGSLALGGGTFTAKDVTSSGLVTGFGTITTTAGTQLANSGLVHATGGTLKVTPGISGSSGNITIDSGAGLNLSSASTGSQVATLTDSGAMNLGAHNITVFSDYNNTNFGVGNSFNKHANVTTTGGLILASGTTSQTLSGSLTGGSGATAAMNFGPVHVGSTNTLNYQINDVGTGGPSMRFAVQTSVNGGNITDSRLSGTGVTAGNVGPVAQGSSSGNLAVTFTATTAGALTGQTIHIANNFDNVSEQSIGVSGTAYNLASSSTIAPIAFGLHHVGDGPITQTLSITNTAPAGSFSEGLNSNFDATTPVSGTNASFISTSGAITNLAAGSTNNSSMSVTLSTATVGNVNANLLIHQASNGATTSLLGLTSLADQTPAVTAQVASGTVVRFASPQINNAPITFANVRVGTAVTPQAISVTNNVPNDGFSESLIGNVVGTSNSQVAALGGFGSPSANPEVLPSATDATHITAAIDTSSAGAKSGNAIIDFKSDGTMFSGGVVTDLGNTNVAVQGNVYRLASPTLNTPTVALAARVGDASPSAGVGVTNTSPDAFTEGLDAGIATSSTGFTAGGAVGNLAAQGSNNTSLKVGLDTSTAGNFSGNATVSYTSNGLIDSAAPVSAGSSNVALTGKVYQTAVASVAPGPVDFGIVHVGDAVAAKSINVANTASGALTDVITGNVGSVTGGAFTSSGTLGAGVAAGSNSNALQVGLNTSTAGVYSGQANLALKSHNPDLADVSLATTPEALSAQINNYAKGAVKDTGGAGTLSGSGASYLLDFGTISQGSGTKVADLAIKNDVAGPADLLAGTFTLPGLPGDLTLSGFNNFTGLAAGASDTGLMASFDTSFAPSFFDVFVTLDLTGSNLSGYNAALPTDPTITLELRGTITTGSGGGPVPEPGSLALLGGGLAGLFAAVRRRRKARPAA